MTAPHFGGDWTEEKLRILQLYLDAYTTALKNQPFVLTYFDAFAGAGTYTTRANGQSELNEPRKGSAQIALEIDDKPFDRLVFVESQDKWVESLRRLCSRHPDRNTFVAKGDANEEVPVFCRSMAWNDRAVVFLDPFATQVSWNMVTAIAETRKIDCLILFPLMGVTRMMPRDSEPAEQWATRLDSVFGDHHWQDENYQDSPQLSLFEDEPRRERKSDSDEVAQLYRRRLEGVFHKVVPIRRTLLNSKNSPLFELFFAIGNPAGAKVANRIASYILENW